MRPARIIAAVVVAAAVAATGSYLALSTPSDPSVTASPVGSAPTTTRSSGGGSEPTHSTTTTGPSSGELTPGRCAASALRGSVQDSDGAAGHIWYRIRLGIHGHMGCLGANSLTYEVRQTPSGWRVGAITAMGPVA